MSSTQALQGKNILITREKSQANEFASLIKEYGGNPIKVPLLHITCRKQETVEEINAKLPSFEWIFFTSAHGVTCFFETYGSRHYFPKIKFATVGHKTEVALKKYGYEATFIPSTYNAQVMSEEFFAYYPNANHILLIRGNISRKLLVNELTKKEIDFDTLVVYDTSAFLSMKAMLLHVLTAEQVDYLTFTSPSTVRAFMEMVQGHPQLSDFLQMPAVCIGTTTEKAAIEYQFKHTFVPHMFTIESMVETMIDL